MADVKWIKITTDVFDDEKILLIESLPEADSIIVIWFKLLCLAGKQNNSGVFMMGNSIPYTDTMLATIFRRKESTVQLALKTFEQFGMIEMINGAITIPNWNKHQSLDSYEKKKERDRIYQAERRARQKAIAEKSSDTSSDIAISDIEEDTEIDTDKNKKRKRIDYEEITELFNSICVSLPKVVTLSDSRKKTIKARLSEYTIEQVKEVFVLTEKSSFLSGRSGSWQANFDWIMKPTNFVKVFEGNYNDKDLRVQVNTTFNEFNI